MAVNMNLRDLRNPQYTAATGRKSATPYSAYLTGMGPYVVAAKQQADQDALREKELLQGVDQFNQSQALERQRLDAAEGQAGTATTISGASTLLSAAGMANQAGIINLKDIAGGVGKGISKLWPGGTAGAATTAAEAGTGAAGVGAGAAGLAGEGAGLVAEAGDVGAGIAANAAAEAAAAEAAAAGGAYAGGAGAGGATLAGVAGTLGVAAGYAAPAIIAAHYGMPILGGWLGADSPEDYRSDKRSSNFMDQAANITSYEWSRPVEAGFEALNIPVPGQDTLAGKLLNPGAPFLKAIGCIIVTACTSADSEEVNIAREFRDKFLTPEQLRGYYMIAEKVVPWIHRFPWVKWVVKRFLVDNLIAYGRYALSSRAPYAGDTAVFVTTYFLRFCGAVGRKRTVFVRANGETV